jgi:hypothetical protein
MAGRFHFPKMFRNFERDVFDIRARSLQLCSEPGILLDLFVTVTALNVTPITEFIRNVTPALLAASCDKLDQPVVLFGRPLVL